MSSEQTVIYEKDEDGLARLTLNRPEQLNAMNLAMRDELWSTFEAFRDDPTARVLIVRERNGLPGLELPRTLGSLSTLAASTLDERDTGKRENAGQPAYEPRLSHANPCS